MDYHAYTGKCDGNCDHCDCHKFKPFSEMKYEDVANQILKSTDQGNRLVKRLEELKKQ